MDLCCICTHALQEDPTVLNDIRDDLRQECEKFGTVKKILIFDVHLLKLLALSLMVFKGHCISTII